MTISHSLALAVAQGHLSALQKKALSALQDGHAKKPTALIHTHVVAHVSTPKPSEEAVAKALSTAQARIALTADVNNITIAVNRIEVQFQAVADNLKSVDDRNLTDTKYAPAWQELHTEFRSVVAESKKSAIALSSFASRYINNYLPLLQGTETDIQTKLALIRESIQEVRSRETAATAQQTAFKDLSDKVHDFGESFSKFANDQTTEGTTELTTLRSQLKILEEQIKQAVGAVAAYGVVGGVAILATWAALVYFPEFAPFILAIGIAFDGIMLEKFATACEHLADLRAQKRSLNAQVSDLENKLASIAAARTQILTSQQGTASIGTSLDLFTTMWGGFKTDLTGFEEEFLNAEAQGATNHQLTPNAVTIPLWSAFKNALDMYVLGIADPPSDSA